MTSSASTIEIARQAIKVLPQAVHTRYLVTAVSFQASPRPGPRAVTAPSTILDRFGQNGAGKVQNLEPMRRRRHRQHVATGFGKQVTGHRDRGGFGLSRDAEPAGDAAALHQIGHDEVGSADRDRFGKAARKPPVLAGLNRGRGHFPDFGVAEQVFLRHRFFDPVQVVGRQTLDTADGFSGIERLVEVDHERDIRTDEVANPADDPLVIGGVAVAALDLDAFEALIERALEVLGVGFGIDHAVTVIGPDRPGRAAEQGDQRLARRLAQRVPERHVEAGHRHADQALPPQQPELGVHRRHQINRCDGLAGEVAADLLDQQHQRFQRQRCVGEDIGVAGNALIGLDINQHQGGRLDHAEGVFDRPGDRRDDGAGPDAANRERGCAHTDILIRHCTT